MNAGETLLSIIVPTYNYGHLLRRVIDSVLMQLTDECELVVVDDGSIDQTPQILAQIAEESLRGFLWVRQENSGAAAARNHGLRLSRGTFLLFLDADDELLPDAIAAICARLHSEPGPTVILGGRIVRWPSGREKYHPPSQCSRRDPCARVSDYLIRKKLSVSHGALIVARSLIEQCPYPERFRGREDIPVFAYLLAFGHIATIEKPLARIHKHQDSLRHSGKPAEHTELDLANQIFDPLPMECQKQKPAYLAARYVAMSENAAGQGDSALARELLQKAAHHDLTALLRWRQARRILRVLLIHFDWVKRRAG